MRLSLQSALRNLSPRRKRWMRFLRSLPLDPDALDRPLLGPGRNDFIICGASRTGTSLVTAALFQPPRILTVMEPWKGMELAPSELFGSLRSSIASTDRLDVGRLDVTVLREEGRVAWCRDGERPVDVHVDSSFLLGVKWPIYWRYLDLLPNTRFIVCVRDPVEVISSYERVGGRLQEGLDYDTAFNRRMNGELRRATSDPAVRRVLLYEYVNRHILPHLARDNVLIVRYERWFTDPARVVGELGSFLDTPLGPLTVKVMRPARPDADSRTQELIRTLAPSAAKLGYAV